MNELTSVRENLKIPNIKRHIFLCADQTNPKCCSKEEGINLWNHLKARLKELNLIDAASIRRTRANCLQVCKFGPIAVIYPDKIWYHSLNIKVLDRIIDEHLVAGKVVEEYLL